MLLNLLYSSFLDERINPTTYCSIGLEDKSGDYNTVHMLIEIDDGRQQLL